MVMSDIVVVVVVILISARAWTLERFYDFVAFPFLLLLLRK